MERLPTLIRPDGSRISGRDLQRGMRLSIAASMMSAVWFASAGGMPLIMFMECLGASGVLIGMLITARQLAMVVQIPAAVIVDRLPTRKNFWAVTALLHRMLWFLPVFLPFVVAPGTSAPPIIMIAMVTLSSCLGNAGAASWFSWMADLIPDSVRGRFWGKRQSLVMGGFLVGMAVAGYILDVFPDPRGLSGTFAGFSVVFGIAAVLGCLDVLVHYFVPEPKPTRRHERMGLLNRILEPLQNRDFLSLTLSSGIWTFAMCMVGAFGILYLKRDFQVTYSHLAAVSVSAGVGTIVAGAIFGYVIDRVGARALGTILMGVCPLCYIVWFFMKNSSVQLTLPFIGIMTLPQPILLLLIVNIIAGAIHSGVMLCRITLCNALAPAQGRTMAIAVHWTIAGLMAALGPLVGGVVMDYVAANPIHWILPTGTRLSFFHILVTVRAAVVWFVAIPIMLRVGIRKRDIPVGTAISQLAFAGNPLRAMSNIRSIWTMCAAASSRRRARAAHQLGETRTAIAVSDLIESLDDPSADVREEAAFALGSIGSPEALQALIAKLEDPNSDLDTQIARALRRSKDRRSVPALMRKLADPNRETRSESARTLGEIGDRRAVVSLMDLLKSSEDAKVVSASSEALARLNEMAAIHKMIPWMRSSRNPVLRRSLAVAMGDLLGKQEEFYGILINEQHMAGAEVPGLLDKLRYFIRTATRRNMTSAVESLARKTSALEDGYQEERFEDCADILFDLAIGLSAFAYGVRFGGDAKTFIEELVWRDEQFGMRVLYLNALRMSRDDPSSVPLDSVDILLGIYFVSSPHFS